MVYQESVNKLLVSGDRLSKIERNITKAKETFQDITERAPLIKTFFDKSNSQKFDNWCAPFIDKFLRDSKRWERKIKEQEDSCNWTADQLYKAIADSEKYQVVLPEQSRVSDTPRPVNKPTSIHRETLNSFS